MVISPTRVEKFSGTVAVRYHLWIPPLVTVLAQTIAK